MKANELRIGNWVNQGNGKAECTGTMIYEINQELLNVEPIELTEKWLINFGFEAKTIHDNFVLDNIEISSSQRIISTNERMCFCLVGQYFFQIQYVHQLQNLFFALTGEELTLK